jgi:hypothetical protein
MIHAQHEQCFNRKTARLLAKPPQPAGNEQYQQPQTEKQKIPRGDPMMMSLVTVMRMRHDLSAGRSQILIPPLGNSLVLFTTAAQRLFRFIDIG